MAIERVNELQRIWQHSAKRTGHYRNKGHWRRENAYCDGQASKGIEPDQGQIPKQRRVKQNFMPRTKAERYGSQRIVAVRDRIDCKMTCRASGECGDRMRRK